MTSALTKDELQVISAAAQRVRVSLLCNTTQMDVALPLDVPIVGLVPQLIQLAGTHKAGQDDLSDDPSTTEAKNSIWTLSRHRGKTPLLPEITLREAGVAEGELLRLNAERALATPTLYDDVVDAAARLNKAGHPGWDATAARWMAFAGVYLASAVWVYLLVANRFASNRAGLAALSVVVGLLLTGAAALAYRRHAQRDIGAALAWSVLPIATAVAWLALHRLGGYGLAAGCAAMIVVAAALFRCVGTGHWGYLTVQVVYALGGLALVAHTVGLRTDLVGAGLAVIAALGCLAVPGMSVRFARIKPLLRAFERRDAGSANKSPSAATAERKQIDTVTSPAAEAVWARVESETLTRSALYTGLAISAGIGACAVLTSGPVHWSTLTFALGCALTLGLHTQQAITAVERSALAIPAVGLVISTCALAQGASRPIPLAAIGALLGTTVAFAVIGAIAWPGRRPERLRTSLSYLTYLVIAALIPLALWAVGAYGSFGFS